MAKKAAAAAARAMSKTDVINSLAEATELPKKDVRALLDELATLIGSNLGKKGPGVFSIPGLVKFKVQRKPAEKERPGTNPFTGEPTIFKAKPARNVVKATPLKALKDMV